MAYTLSPPPYLQRVGRARDRQQLESHKKVCKREHKIPNRSGLREQPVKPGQAEELIKGLTDMEAEPANSSLPSFTCAEIDAPAACS